MTKFIYLVFPLIVLFSCKTSSTVSGFEQITNKHKLIAILPIQSKIILKNNSSDGMSSEELEKIQVTQSKEIQSVIESYLMGQNLNVRIQSSNTTNSKLVENNIDLRYINDEDFVKLSMLLGVDAVVSGYVETSKPMAIEVATAIDIVRSHSDGLLSSLGYSINASTNKGLAVLGLYDASSSVRLWSYRNDIELRKGSTTRDIIRKLMRRGARNFPYQK